MAPMEMVEQVDKMTDDQLDVCSVRPLHSLF